MAVKSKIRIATVVRISSLVNFFTTATPGLG